MTAVQASEGVAPARAGLPVAFAFLAGASLLGLLARALTVARYSTCCSETRRGRLRSLSMVGKLYPTTDPAHAEPLPTANFITQEDLGGARTLYVNDAELRNAPDLTPWRRGFGLPILLLTGVVFKIVDVEATIKRLKLLPGIGDWTAQYIAMRALRWPDAFPHSDLGLRKALGETSSKRILEIAESWRPWRAYALMHLWNGLGQAQKHRE